MISSEKINGKNFLVDVPVKFILWSRPEFTKKGFEVLRQAKPSTIFFVSDEGRNQEEIRLVHQSRDIVKNIDWECNVHRIYFENNEGMYSSMLKSGRYIFDCVDRCIFLEDDNIPDITFYRFCKEMLDKYENDSRIGIINGHNHLGIYNETDFDYFFSKEGSIYGFATWKRSYLPFLEQENEFMKYNNLLKLAMHNGARYDHFIKSIKLGKKGKKYYGHIPGEEFYQTYLSVFQNQLYVIPKMNLVSNIGCTSSGTHTLNKNLLDAATKSLYNTPVYKMNFPIKSPKYVIPDTFYENKRNRLLAQGHPIIFNYRRCIRAIKLILTGNIKILHDKLYHMLNIVMSPNKVVEK